METQPLNAKSLKNIDDSIFVFCLDDYSSPLDLDSSHRNIFHGRNGKNRWFDKALQFIVENNGRAGINGEVMFGYSCYTVIMLKSFLLALSC
jgi:carnitine O-acetyltransferase